MIDGNRPMPRYHLSFPGGAALRTAGRTSAAGTPAALWTRDGDFSRVEGVLPTLTRYEPPAA